MIAGGNWGACEWSISDEGVLTIDAGKAESISADGKAPWYEARESIREIAFESRVYFDPGTNLGYMFKDCVHLQKADLTGLDTIGVQMMHSFFEGCEQLEEVDLSPLELSGVTTVSGMFNSCSNLKRVHLEGIDTGNVVSMIGTFMNCRSLEDIDLSPLDTSKTVDMSWLFCGCRSLRQVDLSSLATGSVVDLSCMFLSCESLEEVNLGTIDTSSVMDTSRMFMYCKKLKTLDLSGLNNRKTDLADDMFFGCSGLRAVIPGENFTLTGSGKTVIALPEHTEGTEEMVSEWRTSRDGVYYIAGTPFTLHYDGNGAMPFTAGETEFPASCGDSLVCEENMFVLPQGKVFREWNTHRDASGRKFAPGDPVNIHADLVLYAIWAGAPVFREVYDIADITYGERVPLRTPRIDPNYGEILSLEVQYRGPRDQDWRIFSEDSILSAAENGAKIRYKATNFVGTTVSEEKTITIHRASYDMGDTQWVLPEDLFFDGSEKRVYLTGLPAGVRAEYVGNTAIAAGHYTASAILHYDDVNYQPPAVVPDLVWTIAKGQYHLSDLAWSCQRSFVYDGEEKHLRLSGLPEGTTPYYSGADAVNAGRYVATAGLDYDIDNFDQPGMIRPCQWEILKTTHDMSGVTWTGPETFIYDGMPKKVELSGLPAGVHAEYTGNVATEAGNYTARAAFVLDDPVNYELPDPVSFDWQIGKATYDLGGVIWTGIDPVYDGTEKTCTLSGVPEGITVSYEGNTGIDAGSYTARAELSVADLQNYNPLEPLVLSWQIRRAVIDTSGMRWNYSSPYVYNGTEKTVALRNIPQEMTVQYEGASGVQAGRYVARAIPIYDTVNYEPPVVEDCPWEIKKASLRLQDIAWEEDASMVYDGMPHGVHLTGLPDGVMVQYENQSAVNAGSHVTTAQILPADPDNYHIPDPVEYRWDIRKAVFDISGARWNQEGLRVFDGSEQKIQMENLPQGVHVSYLGNEAEAAGTYRAKAYFAIDDTDNYLPPDPVETEWQIDPARLDLTGVQWDYRHSFLYDGSEKQILLTGLPEGVDVRYEGNVASEAGEYAAKATLIPPRGSSFRETELLGQVWRIDKAQISLEGVSWDYADDFVYDGTEKSVALAGLPENVRADYIGAGEIQAGAYTARAVLSPVDPRNYTVGQLPDLSWQIAQAEIDTSDAVWTGYETFVYDGTEHKVMLQLPEGLEAIYENNTAINAGNYVATAVLRPLDRRNFRPPENLYYEWSVAKADIDVSGAAWTSQTPLVYTGMEHVLELTGLPDQVHAVCKGNTGVDAGQYIATAVLEPADPVNYNAPVLEPYRWEIDKAELDISNVMWASAGELVYDGTIKVVGLTGLADDVEVEYENNTATDAGTYHASAVLSIESANYVAPQIEGCTWTIAKAVPDVSEVSWNYVFDFTYDGYEKTVELMDLPEGCTVAYEGNTAVAAGDYTATAQIIPIDTANYESPEIPPLEWKILKREYDMSGASWTSDDPLVYDGREQSVYLTGLEEGLEPVYEGERATDAGTYTVKASFRYDEQNYQPPQPLEGTWTIDKAPLDVSGVQWDYDGPFPGTGRERAVRLRTEGGQSGAIGRLLGKNKEERYPGLPEGTTVRYEGNTARAPGIYEAKAYLDIPEQPNHEVKEPLVLTWEIRND